MASIHEKTTWYRGNTHPTIVAQRWQYQTNRLLQEAMPDPASPWKNAQHVESVFHLLRGQEQ